MKFKLNNATKWSVMSSTIKSFWFLENRKNKAFQDYMKLCLHFLKFQISFYFWNSEEKRSLMLLSMESIAMLSSRTTIYIYHLSILRLVKIPSVLSSKMTMLQIVQDFTISLMLKTVKHTFSVIWNLIFATNFSLALTNQAWGLNSGSNYYRHHQTGRLSVMA